MSKTHKDLEFQVEQNGKLHSYKNFEDACVTAVSISASTGKEVELNVITWSKAAARAWMGSHGVEVYEEDPEASIHEQLVIKATARGRVS